MDLETRRLLPSDAEAYAHLRRVMLQHEPLAFLASPEDDIASDASVVRERLSHEEDALFGAFIGPTLVGAVGVYRAKMLKARHKIGVWGMFVVPEHRRAGAARQLLTHAIEHARSLPGAIRLGLSVSETADAALRLYQSLGFEIWGKEPCAVCHEGRCVSEYYMTLDLTAVPNE